MPIRFRCAYCNQLMGIARRKAGTVVRCPTCAGQVVVPNPGPSIADMARPEGAQAPLFGGDDIDDLFVPKGGAAQEPTDAAPPPAPAPANPFALPPTTGGALSEPDFDVDPVPIPPRPAGTSS